MKSSVPSGISKSINSSSSGLTQGAPLVSGPWGPLPLPPTWLFLVRAGWVFRLFGVQVHLSLIQLSIPGWAVLGLHPSSRTTGQEGTWVQFTGQGDDL